MSVSGLRTVEVNFVDLGRSISEDSTSTDVLSQSGGPVLRGLNLDCMNLEL